jgi:hypothetical protein
MGILLHGSVGLTSHIADVIRRAGIPAKIAGSGPNQGEKQGTLSPFALS